MIRIRRPAAVLSTVALLACGDSGITSPSAETADPPAPKGPNLPDPQGPDPTVAPGKIAFASARGGRSWADIYVANADGSGVRRLTLGTSPAWSWDGTRVAFRREANPYDRAGIYVINADGSGEQFLTGGISPAWSSNGTIAFSSGGGNIMLIRPDGTGYSWLLPAGWARNAWIAETGSSAANPCDDGWFAPHVDHPTWSPNAQKIAFLLTCYGDMGMVYTMNADGTDPQLLVDGYAGPPAWSPDGSSIATAIADVAGITIVNVASGLQEAHDAPVYAWGGGGRLDWSPDGRHIAFSGGPDIFSGGGDTSRRRLFVLNLESGSVHRLVPDTAPDYYSDFVDVAWARGGG